MDHQALWLTLKLAISTTAILLAVALPLAWWIASGSGIGRAAAQAIVALPLVLPPTVLGYYLLIALGPLTAPGRFLTRVFGHPLAFSFTGLLIGSVLYSLPFAVQPIVAGFKSVDQGYLEAAAGLGASPFRILHTVILPLARNSLLTGAVLAFTHTVGEFGVVLMLGGNIPGTTRTLSISLFDQVQDFDYASANRTALVLLSFSLATLLAVYLTPAWNQRNERQADVVR
ncbi:MAG: molybdate ABC transporter permease subunit [Edaphobacter sp.]|uniref:molybdate ABC transporter permease subunit n=1 Tax=Edaphobacter sp. TaxID=1934404 RepID=UPI002395D04A|nr:molybdate ABC transporter permease subunit [Edaphobacter sp.]MDE1175077.1 molybdate ABC transporter permease subunit [Edaphobacter sp.]